MSDYELNPVDKVPSTQKKTSQIYQNAITEFLDGIDDTVEIIIEDRKAGTIASALNRIINDKSLPCKAVKRLDKAYLTKTTKKPPKK